ncbi:hypothetical protein [Alcaligenes endophyticus]|uniref:Uncharacterized protein n=1 Tax=Alcaligenes endophyticus TaxID=1929088 RepID=A0ABT8EJ43_9BURK|nr:hypothetical protein [Alcaligenes endophyticus]MCX5592529.1 hypothetical protein [Alcaligenes endophyticus]MDN4121255.1 hypothetical protein [Alcaligenes endophyticus]
MRLSANNSDPVAYEAFQKIQAQGLKADVYLDGIEQKQVVIADTALGYIIRHKLDANSRVVVDLEKQEAVTERLDGVVKIRLVPQ